MTRAELIAIIGRLRVEGCDNATILDAIYPPRHRLDYSAIRDCVAEDFDGQIRDEGPDSQADEEPET